MSKKIHEIHVFDYFELKNMMQHLQMHIYLAGLISVLKQTTEPQPSLSKQIFPILQSHFMNNITSKKTPYCNQKNTKENDQKTLKIFNKHQIQSHHPPKEERAKRCYI